ncbi:MAG TPA: hypothetical protein EYG99_00310 [Candidatus Pacebacteria bacterium]|nr:hypothetical protein [Candidatus Paceibacterota bacterium]
MPNKDETGPRGEGPKTGRGAGSCAQEAEVNQDETREDNQSSEDCGQGRGLKSCGPCETSDVAEDSNK